MNLEIPTLHPAPQRWWDLPSFLTGIGLGATVAVGWFAVATWAPLPFSATEVPVELLFLAPLLLLLDRRQRHRGLGMTVGAVVGMVLGEVLAMVTVFIALVLGGSGGL